MTAITIIDDSSILLVHTVIKNYAPRDGVKIFGSNVTYRNLSLREKG